MLIGYKMKCHDQKSTWTLCHCIRHYWLTIKCCINIIDWLIWFSDWLINKLTEFIRKYTCVRKIICDTHSNILYCSPSFQKTLNIENCWLYTALYFADDGVYFSSYRYRLHPVSSLQLIVHCTQSESFARDENRKMKRFTHLFNSISIIRDIPNRQLSSRNRYPINSLSNTSNEITDINRVRQRSETRRK